MGAGKRITAFLIGMGLVAQTSIREPYKKTALEDIINSEPKTIKTIIKKGIFDAISYFQDSNTEGAFTNLKLPPEQEPAKDFWRKIYTKYEFKDVIFYNPKTHEIHKIVESCSRNEFNALDRKSRDKINNEIKNTWKALKKEKKEEVAYIRGVTDNLKGGFTNILFYLNPCRREFAQVGINPFLADAIGIVETGFQDAVSRAYAVGVYQYLKKVAMAKDMIIDSSVDQRLDKIISARQTAKDLKENYVRYGNEHVAVNTHHSGPENLYRGVYYANTLIEKTDIDFLGKNLSILTDIEKNMAPEDFFSLITEEFSEQPDSIRGTYKRNSKEYVSKVLSILERAKQRHPFDSLKVSEIEYDSLILKYKDPKKKIDISEVLNRMARWEIMERELSSGETLPEEEKEKIKEEITEKMFWLNPSILYLQKIKGNESLLRRFMSRDTVRRITPLITHGHELRVPLGRGQWLADKYSHILDNTQIEAHTRDEPLAMSKAPFSMGDLMYKTVISLRKKARHSEVTEDMLRKVEGCYFYDLEANKESLTKPQRNYLLASLEVVRNDIERIRLEQKAAYWTRIEKFVERVEKVSVPNFQKTSTYSGIKR